MEQRSTEMNAGGSAKRVKQLRLKLKGAEKAALLRKAVETSGLNVKMSLFYNTLLRSCTTEAFHLLDRNVSYGYCRGLLVQMNHLILGSVYPVEAPHSLWVRGLLYRGRRSEMLDLSQDETWK